MYRICKNDMSSGINNKAPMEQRENYKQYHGGVGKFRFNRRGVPIVGHYDL